MKPLINCRSLYWPSHTKKEFLVNGVLSGNVSGYFTEVREAMEQYNFTRLLASKINVLESFSTAFGMCQLMN